MLYCKETFVNLDTNTRFSETEIYETAYDRAGDLYKPCQREYGRCTSKVYIDTDNGARAIGWVFVGRDTYGGHQGGTYLREVWVTVYELCDGKLALKTI